jgi:DNA (cytosine-5)-methyltransferase 3A
MNLESGINVLSLFDGMACCRLSLDRAGIKVNTYYASEIEKQPIKVAMANYPDIVQLGSVTDVHAKDLPKIDLLTFGSPCQGFSFAGKQLNFKDPRSALFFEAVRILNEIREYNPDVLFLAENVRMAKEHENVFSEYLGVKPIFINSQLLSAQSRPRLYWTNIANEKHGLFGDNICTIPQPKDKGILLKHILETNVPEKYYLSEKAIKNILGSDRNRVTNKSYEKSGALLANQGKQGTDMICLLEPTPAAIRGRNADNPTNRKPGIDLVQTLELKQDGKTNCLTSVSKDNMVVEPAVLKYIRTETAKEIRREAMAKGKDYTPFADKQALPRDDSKSGCLTGVQKDNLIIEPAITQRARGYNDGGLFTDKSPVLTSNSSDHNNHVIQGYKIRRLTPIECARLQTVPNDYIFKDGKYIVSESATYKMLGNGWTVDVIAYIFSFIK